MTIDAPLFLHRGVSGNIIVHLLLGLALSDAVLLGELVDSEDDPTDAPGELAAGPSISQRGDIWILGPHRLMCGDCVSACKINPLSRGIGVQN